jgi:hypothetical protein
MVVSGVLLKANLARISTLTGSRNSHSVVAYKFNKLELVKNPSKDDVEAFVLAFKAFCSDHAVDKVVINRRATTGQGAGGAGTFLIEGILLATAPAAIIFIHPATIAATTRKQAHLKILRPNTVDLGIAYDLSFEGLT